MVHIQFDKQGVDLLIKFHEFLLDTGDRTRNKVHHDIEFRLAYALIVKVRCEKSMEDPDNVLMVKLLHDLEFAGFNFFVLN